MPFSTLRRRLRDGGDALDDTREEYCAAAVVSRRRWRLAQYTLAATLTVIAIVTVVILAQPDVPHAAPLWVDEFDALSGEWTIDPNNAFVEDERLLLRPALSGTYDSATHPLPIADFVAETIASAQDATDNAYGIVIGAGDELSAFLISSDGYFSVIQHSAGQWHDLHPWRQWPHVQRGSASNRLRLTCANTTCRFYVNGEITMQVEIKTQRDMIGLIASRDTDEGLPIEFEYLRVWALPP